MTRATAPPARLGFFLTPEHSCAYLTERVARTVFADPDAQPDKHAQTALAAHGFRRSGRFLYKPSCPSCSACVPVRIPVAGFAPSRSQRRTRSANTDLVVAQATLDLGVEQLALYERYQHARHPDGAMVARAPEQYLEYFASSFADTRLYEMRLDGALVGAMVVDHLDDALSAVYTFFDPALASRSLGTFAVLWQVEEARRLKLRWVYLGYWIAECRKMSYKDRFRPLERYGDGRCESVA